jgi:glycosyltransferase involved in cell wall biosynthesis
MRSLAFLSYFYPPLGGGGTPRSAKFSKYLPDHGWRPVVFTGPAPEADGPIEFIRDQSYTAELERASAIVVRVDDSPCAVARLAKRLPYQPFWWAALYPWMWEPHVGWSERLVKSIIELDSTHHFEAVYASCAPFSALVAGTKAAKALGIPFIADMRDLWTQECCQFFPSSLHYRWARRLEQKALRSATAVIANTPGAARVLRAFIGSKEKVTCIPNGFDPSDYQGEPDAPKRRRGDPITIIHAGTLYEATVRRSRLGRYFPMALRNHPRSVEPLAQALRIVGASHPSLANRIRVRLVGYTPPSLKSLVSDLGVAHHFQFDGLVSHGTAVAIMQEADALLALQFAFDDTSRPVPYIPGKVYEYLPTRKPILAPVPPGDLFDLLSGIPQAYVCGFEDPQAIAARIITMCEDIDQDAVRWDPGAVAPFNRREHVRQLAAILDQVAQPAVEVNSPKR